MSVSPDRSTLPAGCVGSPDPCTIVARWDTQHSASHLDLDDRTRRDPRGRPFRCGRRSRRHDGHEVHRRSGFTGHPKPHLATPAKHLLRADLPAARHLGDHRSRPQRLRDNPRLVVVRPDPPPARSRQNLDPAVPATLRVVPNVVHSDSSKPSAPSRSSTIRTYSGRRASKLRLRSIRAWAWTMSPCWPGPNNSRRRADGRVRWCCRAAAIPDRVRRPGR